MWLTNQKSITQKGPDGRSSLLADIRKGHKSRLKNAKDRTLEDAPPSVSGEEQPSSTSQPPTTGDIFSELIMVQTFCLKQRGEKYNLLTVI